MENKTFHLGLCLAGAVSAGAYTAGVMDYLFETLDKWQKRKDDGIPDTPSHNVIISVIGGASAGGMTGIITAAALSNQIKPVKFPTNQDEIFAEQPQNKFYHTWVDLLSKDMFPMMLGTEDIKKNNRVDSLVNADFIDKVAEEVIKIDDSAFVKLPPYINRKLKIFTTLTNLEGFPYEIGYAGNTSLNKYFMAIHNDYACFQLNKEEISLLNLDEITQRKEDESSGAEPKNNGWMPLDFETGKNVETAKQAAMATGAFPVGLRSRTVSREADDVNNNQWLLHITHNNPVQGPVYKTQNIDGGTINNEPFEKVRDVLDNITGEKDPDYNDADIFKSSTLFIDPFPSEEPATFKIDTSLFKTIGYTLSAIVGQGRAKPTTFSKAANPNFVGQFMIAPSRKRPTLNGGMEQVQGEKAIACGAFDGFSGFINKQFRVHDYFLGRFNCEVMLRDYFLVPETAVTKNEIFINGYAGVDKSKFCITKEEKTEDVVEKNKDGATVGKETEKIIKKNYYPIIPVFEARTDKFPIPVFSSGSNWPVIEDEEVEKFRPLVKKRVQAILLNIMKFGRFSKFLLWLGAKVILNKMLSNAAMGMIRKALRDHQLLRAVMSQPVDEQE